MATNNNTLDDANEKLKKFIQFLLSLDPEHPNHNAILQHLPAIDQYPDSVTICDLISKIAKELSKCKSICCCL